MLVDQRPGRRRVEAAQAKLREPARLKPAALPFAGGEEHHDALGLEPPGDEDECGCGGVVEPVRVVHDAEQRLLLRCLGEQAQRRKRDEEAVVAHARCQAKRSTQGRRLRLRKILHEAKHRTDDLMQRREGQVRFRLDSTTAKDVHVAGLLARVFQEGRFADAGLARDDQGAAP